MLLYPVVPSSAASEGVGEVPGGGGLMVAVRVADLVSPAGRLHLTDQDNQQIPDRHRPEPAPRPQGEMPEHFGHASRADTATRTAGAVITLANEPA